MSAEHVVAAGAALATHDAPIGDIDDTVPVLSLRNVSKSFPGTVALRNIDLDIKPGEVHALVGQNGSGKSTLIKVLANYHAPDAGAIARFNGVEFELGHRDADDGNHLRFVHQDLGLVLEMSAMENLALNSGFVTGTAHRVKWREQAERTRSMLRRLGVELDVHRPLAGATPVERTIVAIASALTGWESGRGLLVLDEPTAVLPRTEVDRLLEIVREVRRMGASVLYVSHRLDEIFAVADRVTVLRDGRLTATRDADQLNTQSLAELMVGDAVDASFRLGRTPVDAVPSALSVERISAVVLKDFSLEVAAGEIVGVAGLAGSGAEEVSYVLAGARPTSGPDGRVRRNGGAWQAASTGLRDAAYPLVPADRARDAVIAEFSVAENLSLRVIDRLARAGAVGRRREEACVDDWIGKLQIKVAAREAPITTLSGGNQQKVIMGRCLATNPEVMILAEPTAGVDVGTRQAIYELIGQLADDGLAVIVTSTDTTDLLALCSRVVVLNEGVMTGELAGDDITEQNLLAAMEAPR